MSSGSESDSSALENLSALADGELDSTQAGHVCARWRDDAALRSSWHVYQLIGDVLRSDDLAASPAHDAAFLAAMRERLAAEPVVLTPEVAPTVTPHARRSARWSWMAPSAVAAGFVLVAGALIVTRAPMRDGGLLDATVARVGGATPQLVGNPALAASDSNAEPTPELAFNHTVNGRMLRDSRLGSYLAAHQQFAGTSALGAPSGFLRNAAAEMPGR